MSIDVKAITEQIKSDFKLKEGEEEYFHLIIHKSEFDPRTGEALMKPHTVCLNPKEYAQFEKHRGGFKVLEALHEPKGAAAKKTAAKKVAAKKTTTEKTTPENADDILNS